MQDRQRNHCRVLRACYFSTPFDISVRLSGIITNHIQLGDCLFFSREFFKTDRNYKTINYRSQRSMEEHLSCIIMRSRVAMGGGGDVPPPRKSNTRSFEKEIEKGATCNDN